MGTETNTSSLRIHKNKGFTIMSNHHLRNPELSLKAVGLMSKILSLPDNWNYSISGLVSICKEGESTVRAAVSELTNQHYIFVEKLSPQYTKSGRFEYIYHIYETPYEDKPDCLIHPESFTSIKEKKQSDKKQATVFQGVEKQDIEKQGIENLGLEFLDVENQGQLNTNKSNTNKLNTKEINKEKEKKKPIEQKKQFAEAVYLTDSEYQTLCEKHSKAFVDKCINVLNNYKLSKGKYYKSDYHAILAWVEKKVLEDMQKIPRNQIISAPIQTDPHENPFAKYLNQTGGQQCQIL